MLVYSYLVNHPRGPLRDNDFFNVVIIRVVAERLLRGIWRLDAIASGADIGEVTDIEVKLEVLVGNTTLGCCTGVSGDSVKGGTFGFGELI